MTIYFHNIDNALNTNGFLKFNKNKNALERCTTAIDDVKKHRRNEEQHFTGASQL